MDITCPSCGTSFSVPDGAIGPKGRKLKCSQCAHVWRQMPDDAPEGSYAPMAAPVPPAGRAAPQRATDTFSYQDDDDFAPPQRAAQRPEYRDPPVPMEMDPTPSRRPAPRMAAQDDGDDPFESVLRGVEDDGYGRRSGSRADSNDDPFSDLGFDEGLKKGRDDDDGFSSFSNDDDLSESLIETDDGFMSVDGDAPLPDMFTREPPPRRRILLPILATLMALLVVLGGGGAAAWYWRETIVLRMPETEAFYEMAGIPVDVPGLGLQFKETTSERLAQGGVDTLIIRGFIANVSESTRKVPFLHVTLFDGSGAMVQEMAAQPPVPQLLPGETTGFRVQLPNPSAAARRFDLFWAVNPADAGKQPPAK